MKRRHKYIVTALVVYWPLIFISTHIPRIPGWVSQAGMSDKTLHYLAYLVLVTLGWMAFSPYDRVNWKKRKVWLILGLIAAYGVIDEWLQLYVNRTADVGDFIADLCGTVTGLIILSMLTFFPALLAVASIVIFITLNISGAYMVMSEPLINTSFYFLSYAFVALVWIQHIHRRHRNSLKETAKWFLRAVSYPLALLITVALIGLFYSKDINLIDALTAITGITFAAVVSYIILKTAEMKSPQLD